MTDDTPATLPPLPFGSRLWFAWLCFFRVFFDGHFAARVWAVREPALPPAPAGPLPTHPGPLSIPAPAVTPSIAPAPGPASASSPAPALLRVSMPPAPPTAALQLLSLLQREGRFVDFLQQEIASFPDADVGAAARVVHDGCRKALRGLATIEAVRPEDEGTRVVLAEGFAADAVKLTGGVGGRPPYAGVLRHRGWRATRFDLPQVVGTHDARILAPAEVELP